MTAPPSPRAPEPTSSAPPTLEVRGLVKRFRRVEAVSGLNLTVAPGELVGLIGPNGAGKSTTVKVATGQLVADAGQVLVAGVDVGRAPIEALRRTGYVPQRVSLFPFLTGREVLEFVASARGLSPPEAAPRMEALLKRFHLTDAQHRLTREYSDGMARKLAVAAALLDEPPLLVLDEALTGLDPRAVAEVKDVLAERRERGAAVLVVSHLLDSLERIASRVVLIDHGKTQATLSRADLDAMTARGETLEAFFLAHTGA